MKLLEMTASQIAKEYRERVAFVYSLSPSERWQYGAELKRLRDAFTVSKEVEQVRKG
jgi:hypothetical protein